MFCWCCFCDFWNHWLGNPFAGIEFVCEYVSVCGCYSVLIPPHLPHLRFLWLFVCFCNWHKQRIRLWMLRTKISTRWFQICRVMVKRTINLDHSRHFWWSWPWLRVTRSVKRKLVCISCIVLNWLAWNWCSILITNTRSEIFFIQGKWLELIYWLSQKCLMLACVQMFIVLNCRITVFIASYSLVQM